MDTVTTANADATTANAEAVEEKPAETVDLVQLKATNERLLAESKKNRENFLKAKQELDRVTQTQLQEQGKYKELYEKTSGDLKALKQAQMRKDIEYAVKLHAEKAGMVKPDIALKLGNAELLAYDEANGTVSGVDAFVESIKADMPQLFTTQKTPVINPTTPNGAVRTGTKNLKDMKSDEIIAALHALK